jgi:hypothetical protein
MHTEFAFTLPRGYVDTKGERHQNGVMRLATARDEIEPLSDPRVKHNELYLGILLLSRVVTRLGSLPEITPDVIEHLYSSDYAYLQTLYLQVNAQDTIIETQCPRCAHRFELDLAPAEEDAS